MQPTVSYAARHRPETLELVLIAVAITAWMLPVGFGLRSHLGFRVAIVLPLVAQCAYRLSRSAPHTGGRRFSLGAGLLTAFVLVWVVAFARTAVPGLVPGALLFDSLYVLALLMLLVALGACLLVALLARAGDENRLGPARFAAILTLGLYVAANVIAFAVGIRQPPGIYLGTYGAQMLSSLGVDWSRTLFPFADGINSLGVMAGACCVTFFPLLRRRNRPSWRWLSAGVAASCVMVVLATDARGALLAMVAILALRLCPHRLERYLRWAPLGVSLMPIALMIVAPAAIQMLSPLNRTPGTMDSAQRRALADEYCDGKMSSTEALSNRPIVWRAVIEELHQPSWEHIVGYGLRGQVASGTWMRWRCLFLSYGNPHLVGAHNLWLQMALSIGYLGVVLTAAFVIWLVLQLGKLDSASADPVIRGLRNGVQFIVLIGAIESTLEPDFLGTFVLFLIAGVIAVSTAAVSPRNQAKNTYA